MKTLFYLFLVVAALNQLFSTVSFASPSLPIEPYEVSILFPLPEPNRWDDLISAKSSPGLLPLEVFKKANFLLNQPDEKTYPLLRVVGIRLDPCFTEGQGPVACRPQIRFVWQPLKVEAGQTTTLDAAVHVFFDLSETEFKSLTGELDQLREDYIEEYWPWQGRALGVHPILDKLGLQSSYANRLKTVLIGITQGRSLSRVTFMKLKGSDDFWIFTGFDFVGDKSSEIMIPRLEATGEQEFINSLAVRPPPRQFMGGIFPPGDDGSPMDLIAKDSMNAQDLTSEQMQAMIRTIADFENPKKNNPGTVDCVSCHLTMTVRLWANLNFSQFELGKAYESQRYVNREIDLANSSGLGGQTNVLRMFGYFGREPIIGQRTINETAEVVGGLRATHELKQ